MARGRKPKNQVQQIVEDVIAKEKALEAQEVKEIFESVAKEAGVIRWDVKKSDPIFFFDSELSYELTGYRPIDGTRGLDFDPNWFMEARRIKESTGHYCEYPKGTKAYREFWIKQYKYCREGLTINGYTLTGDNYYFINFYRLMNLDKVETAGAGRQIDFPNFFVKQYEYFHYIELCKRLRRNAVGLKARGVGFSEIAASISVNTYNSRPRTRVVIAAQQQGYVEDTMSKCFEQLNFLNQETEDGFKKLRQAHNTGMWRRASVLKGKEESGWMSDIVGIVADKPNKIRGDRTDLLFYEESGSWPNWKKAFIQGDALVGIQGNRFGLKFAWGTGGDQGPALEGLADAFYNPNTYDVLPYRHRYVENGEEVITAYFIPAYTMVNLPGIIDHRGWTDPEKGKAYYQEARNNKVGDPNGLLIYCAEYCFTPEEALALEGDNQFNTIALTEQLALINIHKVQPKQGPIETGKLEYIFDGAHKDENIKGFKWERCNSGKIRILEHPLRNPETNQPYVNLYVAGIDGIDMGMSETSANTKDPSDFCVVIKRRQFGLSSPQYVCIYKDRPNDITEAYITTLKLLQYYNCQACLETTRTSVLTWFRDKGKANRYLMRRPRSCLSDIQMGKTNLFGAQASETVIQHQLDLIATYVNEFSGELWFPEVLEELIKYSYENKRKFDIVAAMGQCELGDEEMTGLIVREALPAGNVFEDIGYYIDEKGYKRYGVIPKKDTRKLTQTDSQLNETNRTRTSDPRYYQGAL